MYTKFKIKLGMYKDEFLNVAAEKAEKDVIYILTPIFTR